MSSVIRKLRKLLAHFIRQRLEINATSIRERGAEEVQFALIPEREEGWIKSRGSL